ncbi:carboxymuconolactone decarboxylase family protein [Rhodobium gokarnense]|uniref:AhpD family alkylhydroperoxidase n=1 Tax=Rhodobium gokarnense TaxID=364296 RepID=A0ABT3HDB2_9HYPH|nr:carboxymuconolactone decarboxylase family protein [Rhodobium gokarnense]MCW2308393.1 AhpD family alkylhydroperoxidase [Rhodobium gokarnense]
MADSFKSQNKSLVDNNKALSEFIPDTMKAFGSVGAVAYKDGAMSRKHKELIAMAIGIAIRCDGCIAWHVQEARKAGATREEVAEVIGLAIQMGGGPSMVYGGRAFAGYDEFNDMD